MEQLGTKLSGSTSFKQLFKSSLGPLDIVAAALPGNTAATYAVGQALVNSTVAGFKAKYTNATVVTDGAIGTGDGSNKTFTLAAANVISDSLHVFVSGVLWDAEISVGTGSGSVDQVVFQTAPTSSAAVKADYSYHALSTGVTGACVNILAAATVSGGPPITVDACRDGSVVTSYVVDAGGNAVDKWFKAALPRMSFD